VCRVATLHTSDNVPEFEGQKKILIAVSFHIWELVSLHIISTSFVLQSEQTYCPISSAVNFWCPRIGFFLKLTVTVHHCLNGYTSALPLNLIIRASLLMAWVPHRHSIQTQQCLLLHFTSTYLRLWSQNFPVSSLLSAKTKCKCVVLNSTWAN